MQLLEHATIPLELITEGFGQNKIHKVRGIFASHSVVNRNRRVYPEHVLDKAFEDFHRDYISEGRAVSQLGHPQGVQTDMNKVCMKIKGITKHDNHYIGEAEIAKTEAGKCLKGLLESNIAVGVSTRAHGSLKPYRGGIPGLGATGSNMKSGNWDGQEDRLAPSAAQMIGPEGDVMEVQDDMKLHAVDCVLDPSTPKAWIKKINESYNSTSITTPEEYQMRSYYDCITRLTSRGRGRI